MRLEQRNTKEITAMDKAFAQVKDTEIKKSNNQLIFELVKEYPRQIGSYYAKLAHRRWAYISEESVIATLTSLRKRGLLGSVEHERAMGIAGRKTVHQYFPLVKEYPDTAAIKLENLRKGQEIRAQMRAMGVKATRKKRVEAEPTSEVKPEVKVEARELVHPAPIVLPTGKLTADVLMDTMSIKTAREIYDELKKVFG
jgi:hypothetical protein